MYYLKINWEDGGYDLISFDSVVDMDDAVAYIKRAKKARRDEELILEEVCSTFGGKVLSDEIYELELYR